MKKSYPMFSVFRYNERKFSRKRLGRLILLRHGQSAWNQENIFTGWVDIPLSCKGIEESFAAGRALKDIVIDVVYTSELIRAQMTAFLALSENRVSRIPYRIHPQNDPRYRAGKKADSLIPVHITEALNERMYGELQGKNKEEMRRLYGSEQVASWRRSFEGKPPSGESLEETCERTVPFFQNTVLPDLQKGKTVLVSAHGNSLRSIVMHIEKLSKEEVVKLEIATGEIRRYAYNGGEFFRL